MILTLNPSYKTDFAVGDWVIVNTAEYQYKNFRGYIVAFDERYDRELNTSNVLIRVIGASKMECWCGSKNVIDQFTRHLIDNYSTDELIWESQKNLLISSSEGLLMDSIIEELHKELRNGN